MCVELVTSPASLCPLLASSHVCHQCVIASIVTVAVSRLIDLHELAFMLRMRAWIDLGLFVGMYVLTLLFGVQNSIIFAFAACMAMLVQ